jgi:hypothetical protein
MRKTAAAGWCGQLRVPASNRRCPSVMEFACAALDTVSPVLLPQYTRRVQGGVLLLFLNAGVCHFDHRKAFLAGYGIHSSQCAKALVLSAN